MLQPPSPQQANDNAIADMWPYDPGFPNEQRALYQTIRTAREALSVVLRVGALAVAPPSRVANMVNGHEDEEMTYLERMTVGTHQGHSRMYASAFLLYTTIIIFASL